MSVKKQKIHVIALADINDNGLQAALTDDGLHVVSYQCQQEISALPADEHPDLILLILSGDQGGGLACCRNFRTTYPDCALCMIHEDLSEWEESIALELGVDAVVRRPTEPRRVLAQIRALLRQKNHQAIPRLHVNAGSRTVRVNGRQISLTAAEFELLGILAAQPGTVISRETISQHLRELAHDDRDRAIDLRIARIRHKLGDSAHHPLFIRTVRGEGYMLMADES